MLIDDRPGRQELAVSFREQIAARVAESKQLDKQIRDVVLRKLNGTRATGIILQEARDSLLPAAFRKIVDDIDLSEDTIRSYVGFAKKHTAPIKEFTIGIRAAFESALRASNALPARAQHAFASHDPPGFFSWTSKTIMDFGVRWKKYLSARPLDSWELSEAEQFCYGLKPILKVHKTIAEWLARQPPRT